MKIIAFIEKLDVLEKILRRLDLWDIRNHDPPQKVSDYIHIHLCDEYLCGHDDPTEIEYYLCGPPPMVNAIINALYDLGVEDDMIFYDKF